MDVCIEGVMAVCGRLADFFAGFLLHTSHGGCLQSHLFFDCFNKKAKVVIMRRFGRGESKDSAQEKQSECLHG